MDWVRRVPALGTAIYCSVERSKRKLGSQEPSGVSFDGAASLVSAMWWATAQRTTSRANHEAWGRCTTNAGTAEILGRRSHLAQAGQALGAGLQMPQEQGG